MSCSSVESRFFKHKFGHDLHIYDHYTSSVNLAICRRFMKVPWLNIHRPKADYSSQLKKHFNLSSDECTIQHCVNRHFHRIVILTKILD
jgi:hypothetical protein